MSRFSLLFIIFAVISSVLHAADKEKGSKIEVTAVTVEGSGSTMQAKDGVVVYYQDSIIHADRAKYNKEKHLLILDGHVEMIGYQGTKEHASHMEIDTLTHVVTFRKLFFTNPNDVWLLANDANRTDGNYTFGESMLSSCDVEDPLWTMMFSRAKYDRDDQYMKIYNAKVYFEDIPVFYTPYLAFSTNNQRRSGLLFPLFGYSNNEGFIYEQPVFWAISDSMDLEFNPQIRTNRSVGMYATYRFVDSNHSSGQLRAGYFKDKASYVEENNLRNDKHYGIEFLYDSSQVISHHLSGFKDGVYANITWLNDIEYLNLQKHALTHFGQTYLQESRLNYVLYNEDVYAGMYAKYFIDTRYDTSDDKYKETLQTLPATQFHKYIKSLFVDNLTYSLDMQTKRLDRKLGSTLNQVEFRVPIEFSASFFDDYLSISLGEYLYYGRFFFGGSEPLPYDYFQYGSNIHTAKIFSDLTKKYDTFTHVIQPSLAYTRPGNETQSPIDFKDLIIEEPAVKPLFSVGLPEEQAKLALNQYFYDDAMRLVFFQRLEQNYYPNREISPLSDISNEMQFTWNGWRFYNKVYYSYEFDSVSESSSIISVGGSGYSVSVGHTYKQLFKYDNPDDPVVDQFTKNVTSNDINFNFSYSITDRISVNGGLNYNLIDTTNDGEDNPLSGIKLWRLGGKYKRDCWSMMVQLSSNVVPRAVNDPQRDTSPYTEEYSFIFQLNFIPFATVGVSSADLQSNPTYR